MTRDDRRDHEEDHRRATPRGGARGDFGQADYSRDYGYDPAARSGYRVESDARPLYNDYGQADYSTDYDYDAASGEAYRRHAELDRGDGRVLGQPRSWMERAGEFLSPGPRGPRVETRAPRPRRGPSDRVLWAVIVERLEDQRGLDLRDLEVIVQDAEVTLNGTVRHKADKRRIEDVADIDGVRHVQNNLRLRDHGHWTFL
jgi:hypothetical protein